MESRVQSSTGKSNNPINTTLVAKKNTAQPVKNISKSQSLDRKFNCNLLNKISPSFTSNSSPTPRKINAKLGNQNGLNQSERETESEKPGTAIQRFAALNKKLTSRPKLNHSFNTITVQPRLKVGIPPGNRLQQKITEKKEEAPTEKLSTKTIASPSTPPNKPGEANSESGINRSSNFGHSLGNFAISAPGTTPPSPLVKTKLTISTPGNKREQEADTVAAKVVERINQPKFAPQVKAKSIARNTTPSQHLARRQSRLKINPSKPPKLVHPIPHSTPWIKRMTAVTTNRPKLNFHNNLEAFIQRARAGGQPIEDKVREPKVSESFQNIDVQRLCSTCEKEKENETLQAKAIAPPNTSEKEVSSHNQQEQAQVKDKQADSSSSASAPSVETVTPSGKSSASVQPPSEEKPKAKASPVAEAVKALGNAQKNTQLPKKTTKEEGKQPKGEEGAEKEGQGKGKASANIPEAQALEQVIAEQDSANLKPEGKGEVAQPEILAEKQQTQIASNEAQKQQNAIANETTQLASARINFALPQPKKGQGGENPDNPVVQPQRTEEQGGYNPEERARLEKQRAEASNLANNFLVQGASRVQTITALGHTIPSRIKAAAESNKASLMATVEQQKGMVTARIEQQRAQVQSQAQTTIAQIQAQSQAALAVITQTNATNRQQVTNEHQTALQTVDDREKQQLERIEELYNQAQEEYRNTGVKVGDEAISIGEGKANDWESQIKNEDDSFLDGPLTDNRLRARAKAARDVAQQYKEGLIEEANKQADQLVEGKPRDIEAVHDIVSQARDNLQQLHEQTLANLDDTKQQTTAQIKQAQTQLISTVNQSLQGALQSLAQQKSAQLQLLSGYGQRQAMAIERDADKAIASIEGGVNEAADKLKSNLSEVRNQLDGTEAPPPDELSGVFAEILNQFDAAVAAVEAQTEQGTSASEQGINQGGQQAVQAVSGIAQSGIEEATAISQGANTTLTNLSQGASQTFNQIQQTYTTTVTNTVETALKGFSEVTQGVNQTFEEVNQNLERNFQQSNSNLEEGLQGALRGDKQPNLESDIQKYADEAAAQEQPRWKSVLKVVLIIAVIVVAIIVAPAVIGAVGAVAGALGASAAAAGVIGTVVGGAIVGAVSGAVIQMGNNAIDGKNLLDGVGSAALAGAIGGALGGAGGALGQVLGQAGKLGGALSQSVLKFGIDTAFDIAGGIFGDLAVGNPITLEGVLIGAGIGAAVQISTANLGRLGRFGSRVEGMQARTFQVGERFGRSVGGRIKSAFGGRVDVPTGSRPDVDVPGGRQGESLDVPGSRTRSGSVEEPTVKPEEPTVKSEETEVKTPETETSSGRSTHLDEPEIEPGVVAKEIAADGHEIKVLKDGRVVRCTDCEVINIDQNIAQQSDPSQKARAAKRQHEESESEASTSSKKQKLLTGKEKAAELGYPEAQEGYVWVLEGNGNLRYDRKSVRMEDGTTRPQRIYDPETKSFKDIETTDVIPAQYKPGNSEKMDIPAGKRQQYEDILKNREEARAERDRLAERLGEDDQRKLKERRKALEEKQKNEGLTEQEEAEVRNIEERSQTLSKINEQSRILGEKAGQDYVTSKYPEAELMYGGPNASSHSGDFDQVWRIPAKNQGESDLFIIVEAKGGSSSLGKRRVQGGAAEAQQGSKSYFDEIVIIMSNSSDPTTKRAGRSLGESDNVKYLEVRVPITNDSPGNAQLKNIQIREFDLSQ